MGLTWVLRVHQVSYHAGGGTCRGCSWGQECCQSSPKPLLHSSTNLSDIHSHGRWGCGASLRLLKGKRTGDLRTVGDMGKAGWETWAIVGVLTVLKRWSAWGQPHRLTLETLGMPLGQQDRCGAECDRGFFLLMTLSRDVRFFWTSTLWSQKSGRQVSCKPLMPLCTQSHSQICQTLLFLRDTSPFVAWSMRLGSQLPHPLFNSNLVVSAQQWQYS